MGDRTHTHDTTHHTQTRMSAPGEEEDGFIASLPSVVKIMRGCLNEKTVDHSALIVMRQVLEGEYFQINEEDKKGIDLQLHLDYHNALLDALRLLIDESPLRDDLKKEAAEHEESIRVLEQQQKQAAV